MRRAKRYTDRLPCTISSRTMNLRHGVEHALAPTAMVAHGAGLQLRFQDHTGC